MIPNGLDLSVNLRWGEQHSNSTITVFCSGNDDTVCLTDAFLKGYGKSKLITLLSR